MLLYAGMFKPVDMSLSGPDARGGSNIPKELGWPLWLASHLAKPAFMGFKWELTLFSITPAGSSKRTAADASEF